MRFRGGIPLRRPYAAVRRPKRPECRRLGNAKRISVYTVRVHTNDTECVMSTTFIPHNSSKRARWGEVGGHAAFWVLVLVFYTLHFGHEESAYHQSLAFVALLLPITMGTTYFLTVVLIPRFLLPKRYGLFALYFTYTIVASVDLELVAVLGLFTAIARYRVDILNPIDLDVVSLIVGMYLVVFIGVAIDLLKRWYVVQSANAALQRSGLEAELKLREAELELLKAQIHPHFLFNTLNNLYSLTLDRSERASDVVLRISDMLDYMLYHCNAPRVPVQGEVKQIENYLALEQLRYGDQVSIEMSCTSPLAGYSIAPMLLIPFVENGFKHGVSQQEGEAWMTVRIGINASTMTFTVANVSTPDGSAGNYNEGIGLTNLRKRLDMLYPGKHRLDLVQGRDRFTANLTIQLDAVP